MIARDPKLGQHERQDRRLIEPGCCTGCGHPPHRGQCLDGKGKPRTIRTGVVNKKSIYTPCPCTTREVRS